MRILSKTGRDDLAVVYAAEFGAGKNLEFVESVQPPLPRSKKWVLLVSSLYGCPVRCRFCDSSRDFRGVVSKEDLLKQIDFLVEKRNEEKEFRCEKLKIQFARIGEPAFNENVLSVLEILPSRFPGHRILPSVSTIGPRSRDRFFERLMEIRKKLYPGDFQLQFSIHSTDYRFRDWLIPAEKWDFDRVAEYGMEFAAEGKRKITLNFAYNPDFPVSLEIIRRHFEKEFFALKITPVNPTRSALKNGLSSKLTSGPEEWFRRAEEDGYEVILSEGEAEENKIGSNCGQYITSGESPSGNSDSYTYPQIKFPG